MEKQEEDSSQKETWTNKRVDQYIILNKPLGKGQFGQVYKGCFANDETKLVAVKAIRIKDIQSSSRMLDMIRREISILQKLKNPFIVRLYDVARTQHNLYMFFEFCQDGDLKAYLQNKEGKRLSEAEALLFFRQIVEGFKEIYRHEIIHRDIKPANILLHDNTVKISDFGFARAVESMHTPAYLSRLGSPLYMSPQILEGVKFCYKCDVWSVGVLFFEMLYGKTPWTGASQHKLLENIKKVKLVFPETPIRSQPIKDILSKMLIVNEENRITWEEVFEHPLIGSFEQNISKSVNLGDIELTEGYIQNNLVAGYLDTNVVPQQTTQSNSQQLSSTASEITEMKSTISNQSNDSSQKDLSIVMNQVDNQQKQRKNIQKVNEYILYERNIAFFFNLVISKLLKAYQTPNFLPLEKNCYYRLLYCLSKNQIIKLTSTLEIIFGKNSEAFNEELWLKYKESPQYQKVEKLLQNDLQHSQVFYGQIKKKSSDLIETQIKQAKGDQLEKVQQFQKCVNDNFVMDNALKSNYKNIINEALESMKARVFSENSAKELIIVYFFLCICKNPYNIFSSSEFDFHKFYEEIENDDKSALLTKINSNFK